MGVKADTDKMVELIKLTRKDLTTYSGYQYRVGDVHRFPGVGPLCSSGWSHLYLTQPLAELLNPIHGMFNPYRVWRARGVVGSQDYQLKVGCSAVVLESELSALKPTMDQRMAFAIAAVWPLMQHHSLYGNEWCTWALRWLAGEERGAVAASKWWEVAPAAGAVAFASTTASAVAVAGAVEMAARRETKPIDLIALAAWATSLQDTTSITLPPWLHRDF